MGALRRFAALAVAAALAAGPSAAQKPCGKADEANASKAIDRIATWPALQGAWKSWRHCDSGEVADLFTDALLRLVIDWKQVDQLATAMKEAEFRDFVVSHLKSPAAKGDVDDVYSRAKRNCPKDLAAWCEELAGAIKPAAAAPPALELQPIAPIVPTPPLPPTVPAKKP